MQQLFSFIVISILFFSCSKNSENQEHLTSPLSDTSMKLDEMEVGDVFLFRKLEGVDQFSEHYNYHYTQDTLELKVLEKNGNAYLIRERVLHSNNPEEIYYNNWLVKNDSIFIETVNGQVGNIESYIFLRPNTYDFSLSNNSDYADIEGWSVAINYIEADLDLFARNETIGHGHYGFLNVAYLNGAMIADNPGHYHLYSKSNGWVRMCTYSWWGGHGHCWTRIVNALD